MDGQDEAGRPLASDSPEMGEELAGAPLDDGLTASELEIEQRWLGLARVDHEQFFHFYHKYHGPVSSFIRQRVGGRELAEDLTSRTFLHALTHLGRFRWQGVTFGAWLFRIAVNEVNGYYRQRRRHPATRLDDLPAGGEGIPDRRPDSLASAIQEEDCARLFAGMARLDASTQDILVLRFWSGLKLREIAVVMRMPEGTVSARIARAVDRLHGWFLAGTI